MHKRIGVAGVLFIALVLAGCGMRSSSSLNGMWVATLKNPDGTTASVFQTGMTQAADGSLTFPGLLFRSVGSCNQLTLAGAAGAVAKQSIAISISTGFAQPENLVLTLNGSLNGNTISGTWTLTGAIAPCNGNGTFTMVKSTAM